LEGANTTISNMFSLNQTTGIDRKQLPQALQQLDIEIPHWHPHKQSKPHSQMHRPHSHEIK
jgi:hypothetical protein